VGPRVPRPRVRLRSTLLSSCACRGRRLAGFGPPRVLEALTTRLLLEGRKATPCPSPSVPFGDWKTLSDRTRLRTRTVQLLVANLNSALAIGVLLYILPSCSLLLGLGLQSARQTTSAALLLHFFQSGSSIDYARRPDYISRETETKEIPKDYTSRLETDDISISIMSKSLLLAAGLLLLL
jgi:hypothetical protein